MDVRSVSPLKTLRATIWDVDVNDAAVLNFTVNNVIVAAPTRSLPYLRFRWVLPTAGSSALTKE